MNDYRRRSRRYRGPQVAKQRAPDSALVPFVPGETPSERHERREADARDNWSTIAAAAGRLGCSIDDRRQDVRFGVTRGPVAIRVGAWTPRTGLFRVRFTADPLKANDHQQFVVLLAWAVATAIWFHDRGLLPEQVRDGSRWPSVAPPTPPPW